MNKLSKKCMALVLTASLVVGATSCGKADYGDKILTCAGFISEYTVERKYADIVNMSMQPSPELRECLTMSTDSSSEFRPQLAIESTLKYDVLEDTLECYNADQTGSVDVTFTYCDYEEILDEYPIFVKIEDFEQAVAECQDQIEITLTFEFKYVDGIVKLININDLTQLFPYKDIELPLSLGYSAYVDEPEFMGSAFDTQYQCYRDTDCIIANIPVTGDGNLLIWDYYYEIKYGLDVIYTSSEQHDEHPNLLYMDYEHGSSLDNGFYEISFYDLEGNRFTQFSIYVVGNVNPITNIGPTSLYYELPDGCAYADPNLVDMTDRFGAYEFAVEVYVTSVNPNTPNFGYDLVITNDYYVYTDEAVNRYFDGLEDYLYDVYGDGNPSIHPVNFSFDIEGCDVHYVTYYIDCEGNYYDIYYFEALFVFEGETIRIFIETDNVDDLYMLLSGLKCN